MYVGRHIDIIRRPKKIGANCVENILTTTHYKKKSYSSEQTKRKIFLLQFFFFFIYSNIHLFLKVMSALRYFKEIYAKCWCFFFKVVAFKEFSIFLY